jgi:alpha-beta hydrolase superfamily lysophospholipase
MRSFESIHIRYSDHKHYEGFARLWLPDSPRGAVLYLHGIQSHGEWYLESAQRLADAGFAVLMPDRRGSGRNEAKRGHAASAMRIIRDANEGLDELHVRTGLDQFHVAGVSWGGKLAAALYAHYSERIASLTLIAPGLFPKVDIPLAKKLRVGLAAITSSDRKFDIPPWEPEMFTGNPQQQDYIRNDKHLLKQATAPFLIASRRLDQDALSIARMPGVPLHLFLGGEDLIIDNERTKRFIGLLHWDEAYVTEYKKAHHTLEFEADPEPFFSDLVEWLEYAASKDTEQLHPYQRKQEDAADQPLF